jgi:hypothetical protein
VQYGIHVPMFQRILMVKTACYVTLLIRRYQPSKKNQSQHFSARILGQDEIWDVTQHRLVVR